jgi:hypothetical protein
LILLASFAQQDLACLKLTVCEFRQLPMNAIIRNWPTIEFLALLT